jgi:hypothetical protein
MNCAKMVAVTTIEILYFDSCPRWRRTEEDVHRVIADAGIEERTSVRLVQVKTDDDAQRLRFLGSPTVRVDGVDVDPSALGATTFGLQCRVYEHEGRLQGSPPEEWIRAALGLGAATGSASGSSSPPGCCSCE